MSGLEGFALGAAPLAGGALLGGMAGKGTDLRAVIKSELDLLERIPEDQVTRRAALEQVIAQHVNDLVVAKRRVGNVSGGSVTSPRTGATSSCS